MNIIEVPVIVALTFVTSQLFIEHRFHFKRGLAAKCAPGPVRILRGGGGERGEASSSVPRQNNGNKTAYVENSAYFDILDSI